MLMHLQIVSRLDDFRNLRQFNLRYTAQNVWRHLVLHISLDDVRFETNQNSRIEVH